MMKISYYFFSTIIIATLLTGCAPKVRVPITRPAEIDLSEYRKIAIGGYSGDLGYGVAELLTSRLFESNYFEVIDRENIDKIIKEHKLNLSGLIDNQTAEKIGKLVGTSALIFINSSSKYGEKRWKSKYYDNKDGKGKYQFLHIKGTAGVNSSFRIVSLKTGKILVAKTIYKEVSDENWEKNRWPHVDKDLLIAKAVDQTLNTFMKMIAPYTEKISVEFEKSDLPETKIGISFVECGDWKEALEQFQLAKEKTPMDAGAWYNLGVAYEYNYMFKKAIEALKEANRIKPSEKYIKEISNVKRMEADRKIIKRQL